MGSGGAPREGRVRGINTWLWAGSIWSVVAVLLAAAISTQFATHDMGDFERWEAFAGLFVLWGAGMVATIMTGTSIARRAAQQAALDHSYRRLFEALPDATFVLAWQDGGLGGFSEVNEAACRLLGVDRASLLGSSPCDVFADCTPQLLASIADKLRDEGRLVLEERLVSQEGTLPVQAELCRFESAGHPSVLLIVKDLGDRRAAEWALRRRDSQLTKLSSATRRINEDLREDVVLRRLVAAAMQVLGATRGMAGLRLGDKVEYAEYGDLDGFHPLRLSLPIDEGLVGRVWESLGVVRSNEAARDFVRVDSLAQRFHPVSLLAAPIIALDGTLLGCLEVHDKAGGEPFDEDDGLIMLGLASSAAVAIENSHMLEEQRKMREQLAEREERLRRLAGELSRTEERERRRIAEGLHDRIGQELAVMRMQLGRAGREHRNERGSEAIEQLRELLDDAIADTRALTLEISPPMLYSLGLAPAIEWLCEQMEQKHDVAFTVHNDSKGRSVSDDARALLYISVRELLMNVVKHARATSAEVSMTIVGDWLWVVVTDDGVGFSPEEAEGAQDGFGLFSIRERLRGVRGEMAIRSGSGRGTEIVLEVPLEDEPSAREIEDLARDRR